MVQAQRLILPTQFSHRQDTQQLNGRHQTECGVRFMVLAVNEDSDIDTVANNEAIDACEESGGAQVATRRRRLRIIWRDNPTTDPEVRHAESWMQNLVSRVGAVPVGAPLPAVLRRQRGAAGSVNSVPVLEWFVSAASGIHEPVQFHSGQTAARQRPATQSELGGLR